jgi:hypothetical protein
LSYASFLLGFENVGCENVWLENGKAAREGGVRIDLA